MQGLLTTREARHILRISDVTLLKLIRSGAIPAIQFPGTRGHRIRSDDLEDFLNRQNQQQKEEKGGEKQ
jgi:excisionase family DNA binding protein